MTARRRFLRFSLRTLFVAVTVVVCWLGWQLNWIRQRHISLEGLGFSLDEVGFYGEVTAPLGLRALGEHGWEILPLGRRATRQEIRELHALFPEAKILVCGILDSPEDIPGDSLADSSFVQVLQRK
jgi:hypothetical protein